MIGFGLNIANRVMGGVDAQAQAHYDRVIADGGVVPAGLNGVNKFFTAVKTIYGTSDITTAISVGLDAHYLGYKLGAGSGTTLGQAAQKLYSCAGSSGDVVQTTAASQPLLLVHSGANYWWGSGVFDNYVSTPNATANQISGDVELVARIDYKNNSATQFLTSKSNGSGSAFTLDFYIDSNLLNFQFSLPEYQVATSTAGIGNSFNGFIKINRIASTGIVKFYTSLDGVTYTQLGSNVNTTAGNLVTNTDILNVGRYWNNSNFFQSKIYRLTLSNSIGGAPVVDFNPNQYNAATSQTQWTSSTGEVWTINTGTDATGYKGVLVDRTEVQGDGIDDSLNSGTFTSVSTFTRYVSLNPFQRAGFGVLVSGGNSFNTSLYKDGSAIRIYNGGTGVGAITFTSPQSHLLALFTADYNTSNSKAIINNGTEATGTIGDNASDAIILFRTNTDSGNGMISTIISCRTVNNTSEKTAMYNYIKSINNNAF
jgi:hypothetical protein